MYNPPAENQPFVHAANKHLYKHLLNFKTNCLYVTFLFQKSFERAIFKIPSALASLLARTSAQASRSLVTLTLQARKHSTSAGFFVYINFA